MSKDEQSGNPQRVLMNYWRSSCSWRVRIALEWKSLSYEYKAINLLKGEDCLPEYYLINPAGVPTLVDDGVTHTQSLSILEYLEEKYTSNPLLPQGPNRCHDRAQVRALALLIASGIQPLMNLGAQQKVAALAGEEKKPIWTKEVITEGMQGLENAMKTTAGEYCFGDEFTIADCCLAPQVYGAQRFGVDINVWPTIVRVMENLSKHPAVIATHPDKMPDAVINVPK